MISYEQFYSSIFELADLWTYDISAESYASFLETVFRRMTVSVKSTADGTSVRLTPSMTFVAQAKAPKQQQQPQVQSASTTSSTASISTTASTTSVTSDTADSNVSTEPTSSSAAVSESSTVDLVMEAARQSRYDSVALAPLDEVIEFEPSTAAAQHGLEQIVQQAAQIELKRDSSHSSLPDVPLGSSASATNLHHASSPLGASAVAAPALTHQSSQTSLTQPTLASLTSTHSTSSTTELNRSSSTASVTKTPMQSVKHRRKISLADIPANFELEPTAEMPELIESGQEEPPAIVAALPQPTKQTSLDLLKQLVDESIATSAVTQSVDAAIAASSVHQPQQVEATPAHQSIGASPELATATAALLEEVKEPRAITPPQQSSSEPAAAVAQTKPPSPLRTQQQQPPASQSSAIKVLPMQILPQQPSQPQPETVQSPVKSVPSIDSTTTAAASAVVEPQSSVQASPVKVRPVKQQPLRRLPERRLRELRTVPPDDLSSDEEAELAGHDTFVQRTPPEPAPIKFPEPVPLPFQLDPPSDLRYDLHPPMFTVESDEGAAGSPITTTSSSTDAITTLLSHPQHGQHRPLSVVISAPSSSSLSPVFTAFAQALTVTLDTVLIDCDRLMSWASMQLSMRSLSENSANGGEIQIDISSVMPQEEEIAAVSASQDGDVESAASASAIEASAAAATTTTEVEQPKPQRSELQDRISRLLGQLTDGGTLGSADLAALLRLRLQSADVAFHGFCLLMV